MDADNEMLANSSEVTIKTIPLPIMRLDHNTFKSANVPVFETERRTFVNKAATHTGKARENRCSYHGPELKC